MIKIISIKTKKNKTVVNWTVDGIPGIRPQSFWIKPGCRNEVEAQSWALSTLLPIAASLHCPVQMPNPVPCNVLDFWKSKLSYISKFFVDGLSVDVGATCSPCESRDYSSNRSALLMGGGTDSLSTLGRMIDAGEKPVLIRITEHGYRDCDPKGIGYKYLDELSKYYGLELRHVTTNAHEVQTAMRSLSAMKLDKTISDPLVVGIKSTHVISYLFMGFQYFFTSLSVLPEDIGTIILSSSWDDVSEWCGCGFNWENNLPFLGIYLKTCPWKDKISQYVYLKEEHPEMLKWIKSCWSPDEQWCGWCWQCHMSRINMLAARFDNPVQADMNKARKIDSPFVRKAKRAIKYYCDNGKIDPVVLAELNERTYGNKKGKALTT